MIAFGPVSSRRLGRSLDINNILPKICSYSCAYCHVGKTVQMEVKRRFFYSPQDIDMLSSLGIRIAVISNASLIWDNGVRDDLAKADWVFLKVDALDERTWRRMDRPHRALAHEAILQGILDLSKEMSNRVYLIFASTISSLSLHRFSAPRT